MSSQAATATGEHFFELPRISVSAQLSGRLAGALLFAAAVSSVIITGGIVFVLLYESSTFFGHVSLAQFLFDTQWTPLFSDAHYGILPLLCGTLVTTFVALSVALPVGIVVAVFLSEFTKPWLREILKPILELLAAVPTVVYGYFAL